MGRVLGLAKKGYNALKGVWFFIRFAVESFSANHGMMWAAAVSFYVLLSFLPLMLVIASVLFQVLQASPNAFSVIIDFIRDTFPSSAYTIISLIDEVLSHRRGMGIIGVVGLLLVGVMGVEVFLMGVSRIFQSRRKMSIFRRKGISLLVIPFVLFIVGLALLLAAAGSFLKAAVIFNVRMDFLVPAVRRAIFLLPPVVLFVFLFAVYRLTPYPRPTTTPAFVGALFSTGVWFIAKYVFDWYIKNFSKYNLVYGSITALIIMLLWVYYCAVIFLFGAQIASCLWGMERRKNYEVRAHSEQPSNPDKGEGGES